MNMSEWIESILENSERYHYLEGKTKKDLQEDIERTLSQIPLSESERQSYSNRLKDYRYVDEVPEFVVGKHIRWIKKDSLKLTNGGILTDIKFLENGIYLLCKMYGNRFHQYRLEDAYSFQKISPEELVVLIANEV